MNFCARELSLPLALAALALFVPANLLPFMTVEMYGDVGSLTIWTGVISLLEDRSYFVAIIVFVASILLPFVKLLILVHLNLYSNHRDLAKINSSLYSFVEFIGRWSMLDIFLLSILVAAVKLDTWSTVTPGPGAVLFAIVVLLTMGASAALESDHCKRQEL